MNDEKESVAMVAAIPSLIPDRLDEAADYFADDFEWNYFNKILPQIKKNYKGLEGFKQFCTDVGEVTGGTFKVTLKEAYPLGNEFVIMHALLNMTLNGHSFETDAAIVWRIVNGKLTEAWDIPGVYSAIRRG